MATRQIDLHDLTASEAIAEFAATYNRWFAAGYRDRIEIVHGYGSSGVGGVIRKRLRAFLATHSDRFKQITPGDDLGNPGVTWVYPKGRLPEAPAFAAGPLEQAILAFCREPKAEAKILTKLVGRYGDPAIRAAIRDLVRSGALEAVRSGAETRYRATSD